MIVQKPLLPLHKPPTCLLKLLPQQIDQPQQNAARKRQSLHRLVLWSDRSMRGAGNNEPTWLPHGWPSGSHTGQDSQVGGRYPDQAHQCYQCIVCSNIWSKPVHSFIKTIKDKFNLQWLRVSMSYHRLTNLREIFQGDLSRKLTVGLTAFSNSGESASYSFLHTTFQY